MEIAYHVQCQPVAEEELVALYLEAKQRGITEVLESAARQIELELKWHPLTFGEPHYRLLQAGLVHVGYIHPLMVHYGVLETQRRVLILRYRLLLKPSG